MVKVEEQCKHDGCERQATKYAGGVGNGSLSCACCERTTSLYGITTPQRDKMLEDQNGECRICGNSIRFRTKKGTDRKSAVVDHCHTNGHVRGILCGSCNTMLGYAYDNPDNLKSAIKYLEESDV